MENINMTPEQYATIVGNLSSLNTGIADINTHLERLNSKVATQEANMNTVLLWKARLEGFGGALNIGWGIIVALISGAGTTLAYWILKK